MFHVPRTPHAHRLHPEIRRYERGASGAKQLPLELIHHIVESLAERGTSSGSVPPALEACSLVCRTWNHICRLHIFRTIVLGRSSAPQLSFLHFEAPHLSKYIVNLHMIFDDRTVAAAEDWFPDCLKRLEKLRVLRIDNFICIPPTLPALHTLGIMSLIATAHIEQLDLVYWDTLDLEDEPALLPMVSACSTTLQKLSIHICERDDPPAMLELARDLFHTLVDWIEDCIDQLPFPNDIRELTIKLNAYPDWQQLRYPTLEDLKNLYHVVQPLHHGGALKKMKLDILTESWPCSPDTTKEISKVQEAFAPLLERGGFALDIRVGLS
ncbi:hypothetical protein CCMSSC00406_0005784 [Pleurotus cornucopiae]|uniref:Uncharacterized protein n=1 Tax=Pleurotus cornucopiae TaxID=5321 RepID=A0ACB7J922_PLECO|nr:hypothetical protein CCMSSC00406_0005784 [Pleurotus cornucopiae]